MKSQWEESIVLMYFHHFFPRKIERFMNDWRKNAAEPLSWAVTWNDWFSKSIIKKRRDISSYDHPPYHIYHHESSPIIVQCTAFCIKILILVQTSWIRPEFYTFLLYNMSKKPIILYLLHKGLHLQGTGHFLYFCTVL